METENATVGGGGNERSKSVVVEGDEIKDSRKCLLCPVEGDAACMVRLLCPYNHTPNVKRLKCLFMLAT